MALCTVSDVEKVLGVDLGSTDESTVTNLLIPTVEASITNYLGYDPNYSASITEKFDGDRTEDLFLSRSPVVSVTSVTEDGTALTEGNDQDYVFIQSRQIKKNRREKNGLQLNYKISLLFILQVILIVNFSRKCSRRYEICLC